MGRVPIFYAALCSRRDLCSRNHYTVANSRGNRNPSSECVAERFGVAERIGVAVPFAIGKSDA